jgi:hypothetical protein
MDWQQAPPRVHVAQEGVPLNEADRLPHSDLPDLQVADSIAIDLKSSMGRGILSTAAPTDRVTVKIPEVNVNEAAEELVTGSSVTLSAASVQVAYEDGGAYQIEPADFFLFPMDRGQSYIEPYESLYYDVAGWRLYDAATRSGALIVAVGGRYAVLVEGEGIDDLGMLDQLLEGIDLVTLEALAAEAFAE